MKKVTLRGRNFLRRRVKLVAIFFPRYFGLNEIDKKLESYFPYKNGYFVELGANDGVSQSNTKYFELFKNWRGVLIEPHPGKFSECRKNRSKRSKCINAACVSSSYTGDSIQLLYSNLMTIALEGESDIQDRNQHAEWGGDFLTKSEIVYEFSAPSRTLEAILLACHAPSTIDFLSLDVEGNEIEVLKGLDLTNRCFKYILVESRELNTITGYLMPFGYAFVEQLSPHDYLFRFTQKPATQLNQ
jgi:FkbM family methyltransferase